MKHFGKARLNCSPNDKLSFWCKFKAFADDKIDLTKKFKFVLGRVENIVRKGENAGHLDPILLFPQSIVI